MIVRILGVGQFDVAESDSDALHGYEAALNTAVEGDDEVAFAAALRALVTEVRRVGAPLPPDSFTSSDLVVPFEDAGLEETKALLAEPGGDEH
jgi:hypothetical protein